VFLAGIEPGQTALVADIAAANQIPKKFLDAILANCATPASFTRRKARAEATLWRERPRKSASAM